MPDESSAPWPAGAATGPGPFPGTEAREAARVVFDTLPRLPHLPLLPARGPGSDAAGRTAALLVDLHAEVQPGGWRLVARPGIDERRAVSMLDEDLDALEEAGSGYEGPFKVQFLGPWSLAASLDLPRGEKAVSDAGAVRDLSASLAEGIVAHLTAVRRRLPGAHILVQVDEPRLAAVLAGRLPTQSGWGRLRAVEETAAVEALAPVLHAAGDSAGVQLGTETVPLRLLRRAGARFAAVDAATLGAFGDEELGSAVEDGVRLLTGVGPLAGVAGRCRSALQPLWDTWRRLGFAAALLPETVALMPVAGLEDLDQEGAVSVLRGCVELARILEETAQEQA